MNSRFNLVRARSYLPFVAPLFLFSLHPCFLVMSGDYVAILFILFAFSRYWSRISNRIATFTLFVPPY